MFSICLFFRMFNNGVYRAGFAKTQTAYDEGVKDVFDALDRVSCLHVVV